MSEPISNLTGCGCNLASIWCKPGNRAAYCGRTMAKILERDDRRRAALTEIEKSE
ncbi:hypothetical protein QM787_04355 [Rhodococcus ruber]|uniref:hypothetical protein n=1 Tax=Rhodococcus TaxID=1827 RepID=UPI0019313A06|nr:MULTISPECIES: hypothetical protein [Rhodococcus]MCD2127733.1 hypothetical protein [Rhodococcus ruber]MCZ1071682.1 hypothetical protein [Rhodococcus sp. A5(2022)]MCZ4504391.1 hypothetical protein [Rhodococcus ruber]MCZ4529373.1 hypothetical protein [Rhodococcus ruber]MCZ4621052.1 hypothetical protein [Rhodococcus ruber]